MKIKDKFISTVENLIEQQEAFANGSLGVDQDVIVIEQDVLDYFEKFKTSKPKSSGGAEITENGKAIVEYMQKTYEEFDNEFKSREIAEGMFTSSRSVSGAMRKLVNDGFVDRTDDSPIIYSLADKGIEYTV